MQKLRELEEAQQALKENACKELGIQTTSELLELSTQTEGITGTGKMGDMDVSAVDSQIQDFAEMYSAQIQQLKANVETQRQQLSQMEELQAQLKDRADIDIKKQQEAIQKMFLVQSERLQLEQKEIEVKEQRYRDQDKAKLESVVKQTELVEQLSHRQKQLFMYIQEKERECLVEAERMEPLGESCSDESLNGAKGYARHTKASLNKHQKVPSTDINSIRASITDPNKTEIKAQVHATLSSPLSTPSTCERPLSAGSQKGGHRERSPRPQGKASITKVTTTPENNTSTSSSNKHERRSSPKLRTSSVAEKVTARLYHQPETSSRHGADQHTSPSPRRRQQDHSPHHSPQSRAHDSREPIHTRSKSAPGPLRALPLSSSSSSPHHHGPSQKASGSSDTTSSAKRLSASEPRLPSQPMLSNHPRLRQSSSSLASVAESIDESLEDDRLETPGKDSAFDEVSMDTLDSLQDEFPPISFNAHPHLSKEGAGSPSPGRPPGGKDPPGTTKSSSSKKQRSPRSQEASDTKVVIGKSAFDLLDDEQTGSSSSGSYKDLSAPQTKKQRLISEGTESGVEIREDGSGDEIVGSTAQKGSHPDGDIPHHALVEVTTPGSIPCGQQSPKTGVRAPEAGSSAPGLPGQKTDRHIEALTFHTAAPEVYMPHSTMTATTKAGASMTEPAHSMRSKSSSPARKTGLPNDEDTTKRKSRSTSVKQVTSKKQPGQEESKTPSKRPTSGKSPSTERKGTGAQKSGSSPVVGRRGSEKNSRLSPSPSLRRKGSGGKSMSPSPRSGSQDSTASSRDRSASIGSSPGQDRRMSIDSISSLDSNTSRQSNSNSKKTAETKPPSGSVGRKGHTRKTPNENEEEHPEGKKGEKGTKKREHSKDLSRAEAMLSKPKKRTKEDIPVEIYLPTGAPGGGGGGVSLDIGSEEGGDYKVRTNDPTHEVFARSLRSGPDSDSAANSRPVVMEEVSYTEDGTKIIRRGPRRSGSIDSLSSTDGRGSDKGSLPTRRHPDGQTQTSEEGGDTEGDGYNWRDLEGRPEIPGSKVEQYIESEIMGAKDIIVTDSKPPMKHGDYSGDSLDEGDDGHVRQYGDMLNKQLEAEEHIFSEDSLDWDSERKQHDPLCQSDGIGSYPAGKLSIDQQDQVMSQSAPLLMTKQVLPAAAIQHQYGEGSVLVASKEQAGPTIVIDVASDHQPESLPSEDQAVEGVTEELSLPTADHLTTGQISADSLSEVVDEGTEKQQSGTPEDQSNNLK